MNKLFEISKGKQSALTKLLGPNISQIQSNASVMQNPGTQDVSEQGVTHGSRIFASQFLIANPNHVKSLNMNYKKKEAFRIDEEN